MLLRGYQLLYRSWVRPALFASGSAQTLHDRTQRFLAWGDGQPWLHRLGYLLHTHVTPPQACRVGGVMLPSPLILAAGFIKGLGFADEITACQAVEAGINIIPGWATMPHWVGAVELGSFTRYPRIGNPGRVIWREPATQSTQNRVGLKNPGAQAAAQFLKQHPPPAPFGINLAVSPGVQDAAQEAAELAESLAYFLAADLPMAWVTLNLSCPNTEDDPTGHQTAQKARLLAQQLVRELGSLPLWVKVSPGLTDHHYHQLLDTLANEGVQAIIATNTLAQPSPADPHQLAGVGGGRLHQAALRAVEALQTAKLQAGHTIDIIGCGGAMDADSYQAFRERGAGAVQYWSALVYQGPLASAVLQQP